MNRPRTSPTRRGGGGGGAGECRTACRRSICSKSVEVVAASNKIIDPGQRENLINSGRRIEPWTQWADTRQHEEYSAQTTLLHQLRIWAVLSAWDPGSVAGNGSTSVPTFCLCFGCGCVFARTRTCVCVYTRVCVCVCVCVCVLLLLLLLVSWFYKLGRWGCLFLVWECFVFYNIPSLHLKDRRVAGDDPTSILNTFCLKSHISHTNRCVDRTTLGVCMLSNINTCFFLSACAFKFLILAPELAVWQFLFYVWKNISAVLKWIKFTRSFVSLFFFFSYLRHRSLCVHFVRVCVWEAEKQGRAGGSTVRWCPMCWRLSWMQNYILCWVTHTVLSLSLSNTHTHTCMYTHTHTHTHTYTLSLSLTHTHTHTHTHDLIQQNKKNAIIMCWYSNSCENNCVYICFAQPLVDNA